MKHISTGLPKKDQIINFKDGDGKIHDFVAYCETMKVVEWEAVMVDYTYEELMEKFKKDFGNKYIYFSLHFDLHDEHVMENSLKYEYVDDESIEHITDYMANLMNGDTKVFRLYVRINNKTSVYNNTISFLESHKVGASICLSKIIDEMISEIIRHQYKNHKKELYA